MNAEIECLAHYGDYAVHHTPMYNDGIDNTTYAVTHIRLD